MCVFAYIPLRYHPSISVEFLVSCHRSTSPVPTNSGGTFPIVSLQLPRDNIVTSFSLILGVLWPWFWTTAEFLCWGQVNVLRIWKPVLVQLIHVRIFTHSFILDTCLLIIDRPRTQFCLRVFTIIASVPKVWKEIFSKVTRKSTILCLSLRVALSLVSFLWNAYSHSCMSTAKSCWVSCSDYLVIEINLVRISTPPNQSPSFLGSHCLSVTFHDALSKTGRDNNLFTKNKAQAT